tara:strand:- start:159 stop:347 length:189 start_codon:yes stop_codon:yes gene_type:complete
LEAVAVELLQLEQMVEPQVEELVVMDLPQLLYLEMLLNLFIQHRMVFFLVVVEALLDIIILV